MWHDWAKGRDKNLGGCHEQDKNRASAPVWLFLSSHTFKGEMHMKCVQCLFLTSQAKGHDGSVPLLCLSQGQLQMPCAEIWCSPLMPWYPLPILQMLPYVLKMCLNNPYSWHSAGSSARCFCASQLLIQHKDRSCQDLNKSQKNPKQSGLLPCKITFIILLTERTISFRFAFKWELSTLIASIYLLIVLINFFWFSVQYPKTF